MQKVKGRLHSDTILEYETLLSITQVHTGTLLLHSV